MLKYSYFCPISSCYICIWIPYIKCNNYYGTLVVIFFSTKIFSGHWWLRIYLTTEYILYSDLFFIVIHIEVGILNLQNKRNKDYVY